MGPLIFSYLPPLPTPSALSILRPVSLPLPPPRSLSVILFLFLFGALIFNRRSSEIQGTALGKCIQAWPVYWAIQRSWFARVNALCNLSRKKSREVAAHFRADF